MKVVTKHLLLDGEDFAIVEGYTNGARIAHYYGTINYKDIDENGKLRRPLNGHDMCIAADGCLLGHERATVADAIEERRRRIEFDKKAEKYIKAGYPEHCARIAAILND